MGAAPAGRLHSHLNYKAHFACQDQNTAPHIYGEPQRVGHGVQGMEANKTHLHIHMNSRGTLFVLITKAFVQ